jgi:aryl-alcohol dehydrogenase-like predicted oxidoreductase
MFQRPPGREQLSEAIDAIARLKQQGKIRFSGISCNDVTAVAELQRLKGIEVVMFSQSLLTLPRGMLRLIERHRLGGMVRGVFESGRLGGRCLNATPRYPADDMRCSRFSEADFTPAAAMERIVPNGLLLCDLALRYVLDFPTTHVAILGGRSIDDYRQTNRALHMGPLSAQTRRDIDRVRKSISDRPWIGVRAARRGREAIRAIARRCRLPRLAAARRQSGDNVQPGPVSTPHDSPLRG